MTASHIALAIALLVVAITWWAAGRIDRLNKPAQLRRVAAAGVDRSAPHQAPGSSDTEGGNMDHKASVASLLGSAAGAADALTDCGLETDDTELVAGFIETIDKMHGLFVDGVERARKELLDRGTPPEALNDLHETLRLSMVASPACTNMHFMWRLASILKRSTSPDVVEAARDVVKAHASWDDANEPHGAEAVLMQSAVAKLAAALPKE